MYDPKENKPVTYLDVLRGPAEKYDLLRDDGTDLMGNVPTYVRNKMDLIKESYPDFFWFFEDFLFWKVYLYI